MTGDVFHLPDALVQWIRIRLPGIGDPNEILFRSCRRIPFWWIPGNRNMSGLTLGNHVYVRAEHCPIDPANKSTVELVFHELVHVLQFRRNPLRFPLRYLLHHLMHGYANNPAEIEAREIAARLVEDYFQNCDKKDQFFDLQGEGSS
jgi:hypothetical protein